MSLMLTLAVILAAMVFVVPLARRLRLGSVIGYLVAGILVGPACLGLVSDYQGIQHVAELGIVMLLFLIGLEIRPQRLKTMRKLVFGFGLSQVVVTTALIAGGLHFWWGMAANAAVVIGFGLALSSTALILPLLGEKGLLNTTGGRNSFAVLLFQDIAIIPMLAALPLLVGRGIGEASDGGIAGQGLPWLDFLVAIAAVLALVWFGRYLVHWIYRFAASQDGQQRTVAISLAIVLGTAVLIDAVGLSMSLGAFLAGVILSGSEFRHDLRADIEPFEGILLGLFFVSVGMSVDLSLLAGDMEIMLAAVAALVVIKVAVGVGLSYAMRTDHVTAWRTGLALGQGGEFGFVLFAAATSVGLLSGEVSDRLLLIIVLSMLTTPALLIGFEALAARRRPAQKTVDFDQVDGEGAKVVIIGFNRVGQILGRILSIRRIPFTALESDLGQVDFVRRFGNEVYYGDATRPELLRAAGAGEASLIVVALEDREKSVEVVKTIRAHYPNLAICAVAETRRHAHMLMEHNVNHIVRSTFHSALTLSEIVLEGLKMPKSEARKTIEIFAAHDERALVQQFHVYKDTDKLIAEALRNRRELEALFASDEMAEILKDPAGGSPRR